MGIVLLLFFDTNIGPLFYADIMAQNGLFVPL